MREKSGFLDWKAGQDPNVALLYIGYCCCCGLPFLAKMHYFRNEMKEKFSVNDSQHWLAVIIGIYGIYINDVQLTALEQAQNIPPAVGNIPWWLPLFFPPLWPLALAKQMERFNVLFEKNQG